MVAPSAEVVGQPGWFTANRRPLDQLAPADGIVAEVEAAMLRDDQLDARLDARRITVHLSGTELTLRGSVRSWMNRRQAEHTAWGAAAVTSVNNDLLVNS